MQLKRHQIFSIRAVVLILAVLLGIVIGMDAGSPLLTLQPDLYWILPLSVCMLGIMVFVAFRLGILPTGTTREERVDKDLLDAFLTHIPDRVFFKDRDSHFVRMSSAMAKCCSFSSPSQAIGKTDADIFDPEHAKQALADEQEIIRTGRAIIAKEEKEIWPDGHVTWALTTKVPLKDRLGRTVGTMGIAHDITGRMDSEARIQDMLMHDTMTGLPNRTLLEERLSQAMAKAESDQMHVAVLILDMDGFSHVNDSAGYYTGDRVLELIAKRLKKVCGESDTVARVGGDEFAVVLSSLSQCEEAEVTAQKILTALSEPAMIAGNEIQLSAGIGISFFPEHGSRPETLLQSADAAMYESKKRGRGKYCFFSPTFSEASRRRNKLETDLVHATEREEFVLQYQPFVNTETGNITGFEALLRWRHPEEGMIAPSEFISELERIGLMVGVGRWVLRSACRQAVDWMQMGLPPLRLAVNVSGQQFYEGDIVNTVRTVLHETGMNPKLLELELTESHVLDDSHATLNTMRQLKQLGVQLALDDFGTGWSSLSYLRRFPLDRLKIDRAFVRDLGTESTANAVVKSILNLAGNLGLSCIAEGVETMKQHDYLKGQRCQEMQGFYFSRPLAAMEATVLQRSWKPGRHEQPMFRLAMESAPASTLIS